MWIKNIADLQNQPSDKIKNWIQKPGNLGAELRKTCNRLELTVIEQTFNFAFDDEYEILNLPRGEECFIRKIFLSGDGVPLTYGRVVIPRFVYLNHEDKFSTLGNKLIGETLLYGNPNTIRSSFEYATIDCRHSLFNSLIIDISTAACDSIFWARRSIFQLDNVERLLITEVFLQALASVIPPI